MTQVRRDTQPRHPLPGSPEATSVGCVCSFGENNTGIGVQSDNVRYWVVVERCPVHGREVSFDDAGIDVLLSALKQIATERDRHFNMKRVNAGLYGFERAKVQKARAALQKVSGTAAIDEVLSILGEPPPPDLHLHDLLDAYGKKLAEEYDKIDWVMDVDRAKIKHLQVMCELTKDWFDRGETDKANRWLGFIQGCLWLTDIYTIDQMREHIKGKLP